MVTNGRKVFQNSNNGLFTVSATNGGLTVLHQYMGQGVIQVAVSNINTASEVVLKDFPYDFRIIDASFNVYQFGKASHTLNLYRNTNNAASLLFNVSALASRGYYFPVSMNFNKLNISKSHKILIDAVGASWAAGTNVVRGMLTLYIRPF